MARADSDSEDEYGDDFEDYYEQVELQAPAPSKHQASTLTGASKRKSSPGPALSDLEAIQDALKNENSDMANRAARIALNTDQELAAAKGLPGVGQTAKGLKSSKSSKGPGAKQAKYAAARPANPLGASFTMNSATRRALILRTRVALVSERYVAFDQPPLTEHQLYRLRLRSTNPSYRE